VFGRNQRLKTHTVIDQNYVDYQAMTQSYNPDGPIKILVVSNDSSELIQTEITDVLMQDKRIIVVGITDSGAEAMKLTSKHQPHIVLVNDVLNDIDGISLIKNLKNRYPANMCIMISEREEPLFLRQAILAGAVNFIKKPIDAENLLKLVQIVYRYANPVMRLC
jgi:pilus assembly protein CpaE